MDNRPNQVPDASFPSHPGDEGETNHPGAFFPPSAPSFVPTPSNSMHHCEAIPYNSPGLPALEPPPVQSYDSGFSTPAHPPVPSSLSMPPQQRYQEPQGQQPVPSPISIPRRQQDQEQQHPQWQQHPQGQQQQGQQTVLMPMICDGCSRSPELRGKCNRQYPCCYTCDQEHKGGLVQLPFVSLVLSFCLCLLTYSTACTYTRIPPGCKLCKNAGRNCDRTMPRCSDCQAQGLCKPSYTSTPYSAIVCR